MTVDPNRVECDYCGHDTRGRSHEHYDTYFDGQVRHLVTSLCCGCECARERADLADMLKVADSLYLLPGWSRSRGAQIEVLIARLMHMPIERHPGAERGGSAVDLLAEVYDEINRQDAKWGDQSNHPDGTHPYRYRQVEANYARLQCQQAFAEGRGTWRHILDEEVAEAYTETGDALRVELIQVAAVATQWAAAIERRAS